MSVVDRVRAAASGAERRAADIDPSRLLGALAVIQLLLTVVAGLAIGRSGSIGITVVEVGFLMPVALVVVYETGRRLGGRSFALWAAVVWIALPYAGLVYANHSFRHDYAHGFLRRVLGLAYDRGAVAMVCFAVAGFFALRAIEAPRRIDLGATVAAAAVGASFAPRAALAALAPLLGLLLARRVKEAVRIAVPLLILLGAVGGAVAVGLISGPFVRFGLHAPAETLSSLSEKFWSGRVLEWLAIAGVVGAMRGNRAAGVMLGFAAGAAFMSVHGETVPEARNAALLYALLPAWPAVALTVASVPLLWPRRRRLAQPARRIAVES